MKRTLAAGAIVASSFVAACSGLPGGGGGGGGGGTKGPPNCTTTAAPCFVHVKVSPNCPQGVCLNPESTTVKGVYDKVKIVWQLPGGYRFCPGDGVTFKHGTNDMFYGNSATDDPNGDGNAASGVNYRWMDKNRDTQVTTYPYSIRFHAANCQGNAFERDPDIINEM